MKLVITIPPQVFEYDLADETALDYFNTPEEERDGYFDSWTSDTWPEMEVKVVAS